MLHGTLGTGSGWGQPFPVSFAVHPLLSPGAPFDISDYDVIAPNTIGSGKSSRPSDGLRMKFPSYNLKDLAPRGISHCAKWRLGWLLFE